MESRFCPGSDTGPSQLSTVSSLGSLVTYPVEFPWELVLWEGSLLDELKGSSVPLVYESRSSFSTSVFDLGNCN